MNGPVVKWFFSEALANGFNAKTPRRKVAKKKSDGFAS
jgi:hypothetical protein